MNIVAKCTPPCAPANTYVLPGAELFASIGANQDAAVAASIASAISGDDADLVESGASTSASAGTWTQLMPADANRHGASVQNKAASGSIFILQFDTSLPTAGTQVGETEIPQAPGYFNFPFAPNQRYVIRGANSSMAYSLNTW